MSTATALAATIARRLAPPPAPPALVDFARGFRWTEGPRAGEPIEPEKHPAQFHAMTAIGDGLLGRSRFRRFIFVKPKQDGGTWTTISLPLIYTTTQLHRPYCAGFPDMRLAGLAWRNKVRPPIIKANRADWLPDEGPGSDGNSTPVEVALAGTPAYWIGGGASNEAGQASLTAAVLSRDELDAMDPYVAELMTGRTDSYGGQAVVIDTSTIMDDEHSMILAALQASTCFRIAYACPHCSGYQVLDWERVRYDPSSQLTAQQSVRYACAHCDVALTDAERLAMLDVTRTRLVARGQELSRDGTVTGPIPEVLDWGLLWTALESPIKSLSVLAAEHWVAQRLVTAGDHAKMRRFWRDRMSRQYHGDRSDVANLDATALATRSAHATYGRRSLPADARYCTAAVDMQKRELWWLLMAHADDGRFWIVDWGREVIVEDFRAEPIADDVHAALDRMRGKVCADWRLADDTVVPVLRKGIDVGYQPDAVLDWIAQQDDEWCALRGAGDGQLSDRPSGRRIERIEGWIDVREGDGGRAIHFVEVDLVKDRLHAAFARQPNQPGAGHLPQGQAADDWLCKQLTAERKVGTKWVRVRRDNHLGDCGVYSLALARLAADGDADGGEELPVWGRR